VTLAFGNAGLEDPSPDSSAESVCAADLS